MIADVDTMTLATADRLCTDALAAARVAGFAASAAVVDGGGHLVAFRRDNGAVFVTARIAERKAWTATASGMPTEEWNMLTAGHEVAPILHGSGLMAVAGGMPITVGGRVIGGLGVSGGTTVQDREATYAALELMR